MINLNQMGKRLWWLRQYHPPVVVIIAMASLTSVLGYRFYHEPQLDIGTKAPQTIVAPEDASVEDPKATEEQRKEARIGALPVVQMNPSVNQQVKQALQELLEQGQALRQQAGPLPFVSTGTLSTTTQSYLRQVEAETWQTILQGVSDRTIAPPAHLNLASRSLNPASNFQAAQQQAITELSAYRASTTQATFVQLLRTISEARWQYYQGINALNNSTTPGSSNPYDRTLFDLSDATWQEMQVQLRQITDRMLAQGIYAGLPNSIWESAVATQVRHEIPEPARPLGTRLLLQVLKPNLIKDLEQTRLRTEQVAQAVAPVIVTIQQGEIIVQEKAEITSAQFVLLDHFGLSRREIGWLSLLGFSTVIGGSLGIFWLVKRHFQIELRQRDYHLLLMLALSTPFPALFGLGSTSLPAIGLLVGSFYSPILGMSMVGLLTAVLAVGTDINLTTLIASSVSGLVGTMIAGRLRSREEFALLGGLVGLTQGGVYLLLNLMIGPAWYIALGAAATQALIGITWSILTLGISPYLEHLFDLVTPIRLAELANPNRPLLKRLAQEAPGTFQHTLMVATLAEAAAKALHCNVELVRAGTLYHDIGKMHSPQSFIENQRGGPNWHDQLNDPWQSAEIIKKHVSEGLVMARKARLPTAIKAFIPEHQGTMLIVYFYHQAQLRAREQPDCVVREADFRYDGPIPQSRETGIVMLADSCEAALRSLKEADPEEALVMINRILKARWQDQQLADSGLTRDDLGVLAQVFVEIWQQCNHQRIAYPKPLAVPSQQVHT